MTVTVHLIGADLSLPSFKSGPHFACSLASLVSERPTKAPSAAAQRGASRKGGSWVCRRRKSDLAF